MSAIMGEGIQLFLSGQTLACATSCSVQISADEIDTSCKDCAGFASSIPGRINWTVSSDNLFVVSDYNMLVEAMINKTTLDLVFAQVSNLHAETEPDADGHYVPSGGWKSANDLWHGKVTVSSIDLTADNGSVATYSVTLQGHGALAKGGSELTPNV